MSHKMEMRLKGYAQVVLGFDEKTIEETECYLGCDLEEH